MKNTHQQISGIYTYGDTPQGIKEATIHFDDPNLAHGFTQLPNPVLRDKSLSSSEVRAYALLLMFAWQDKMCFPGQEVMAFYMGCDKRTVISSLKGLQKHKLIRIERRGQGKTNIYHIRRLTDAYPLIIDKGSGG